MKAEDRSNLERAIRDQIRVQIAYRRADGTVSLHVVAPVDIRFGETDRTRTTEYVWAFCYAEGLAEMHLCDRVLSARVLTDTFDGEALLGNWPHRKWPLPKSWTVPRQW